MATKKAGSLKKVLEHSLPSWVAPWFTIPQIAIKLLQMSFAVVVLALISTWDSNGVTLQTIIDKVGQDGAPYIAVMCVAACSLLYGVAMLVVGFVGISIPPQIRTLLAGYFLLMWMITLPILSAKVTTSKYQSSTRILLVNYTQLEVSVVTGFLAMFSFLADILTGLMALNKYHHKRFSKTDLSKTDMISKEK